MGLPLPRPSMTAAHAGATARGPRCAPPVSPLRPQAGTCGKERLDPAGTAALRLEQLRRLRRWLEAQVGEGVGRRDAAAGGSLEQAALEEVGLVDVLDRVLLLPHRDRERREADGSAAELLAHGAEDLSVQAVEAEGVDLELGQRGVGDGCGNDT